MGTSLPPAGREPAMSVSGALASRCTRRELAPEPLSLEQLASLLWAAQGVRDPATGARTVPSAAAQYPLHVLVSVRAVDGLAPGLYDYDPAGHRLDPAAAGDPGTALAGAAIGEQPWVRDAAAVIAIAADTQAINRHFASQPPAGRRGERYAWIEAGAAAQNVHLVATALGLAMVLVGGFDDEAVATMFGLAGQLDPVALLCVGHTRAC